MQIPHRLAVTESSRNRIWQIKQRTWNDPEAAVRVQTCGGPFNTCYVPTTSTCGYPQTCSSVYGLAIRWNKISQYGLNICVISFLFLAAFF